MDLPALLSSLTVAGFSPSLDSGQLVVIGAVERLTAEHRQGLREHKEALRAMLEAQQTDLAFADTPSAEAPFAEALDYFKPCTLDHRNPENWEKVPDGYGRDGFEQVKCRGCGRFYGYAPPKAKATTTSVPIIPS